MDRKRIATILGSGQRGSWRAMRRDHAKLTQAELAQRAGVSRPTIQAFESGRSVSQEVRDKVRRALAEAIEEREEEEALLHGVLLRPRRPQARARPRPGPPVKGLTASTKA